MHDVTIFRSKQQQEATDHLMIAEASGRTRQWSSIQRTLGRIGDHRWLSILALLIFAIGVVAGISSLTLVTISRRELARQNATLLAAERLLSSVKDVETSYRGYALTGDEAYLEPLRAAEGVLPRQLDALKASDAQRSELSGLIQAKENFAETVIEARRAGRTQASAELTIMDRIRSNIASIQEGALRAIRRVDRRESFWLTLLGGISAVALPLSFLSILGIALLRRRQERIATERLRLSEERHRKLIESSASIIWTANADGCFRGRQKSWARFTGQAPSQYEEYGWLEAVHPEDQTAARAAWDAAVAQNELYAIEMRIRRSDGVWRMMQARAVPLLSYGTTREWVGTHTDITEEKLVQEQLSLAKENAEQANLAKSAFIANMSHELRTPLSAIIGYSEMLQEEMADGAPAADLEPDMRKIEGNARHLLGLINDVLDLSKVESGKMDVYPEAFDLEPIIHDVATTAQTLIEKNGNRLEKWIAPGLGRVVSDLTKVRQILLNLLSNAAKFTDHGVITLSAKREAADDGERIVFEVSDSGIGMTEEQLSRLFQRFVQADASTTRKYGGTGLGLSLTKALSEILGGSITVESAAGKGTTFTVSILANLKTDPPNATAEPEGATAQGELVLVIDDDADQRVLMTKFLNREGFRARTAGDGTLGLALARDLKPRAILLDVMMPGIDGWSVLSALKADPELNAIPVIMVTFVEQRALAASLGAADYVMKPVRWDLFKSVMDRYRPPESDALVIDDDPDTRARIRKALERDGWSITEAENGQDGLDKLGAAKPGLILLDLTMPVMDGFSFLQAMRAKPEWAAIPVVVLTALDLTREDRRRLSGANQILHKGDVSMRSLVERLHGLQPKIGKPDEPSGLTISSVLANH